VPLLAVLALALLAAINLRALGGGQAGLLHAPPLALVQQVAAPLLLAAGVLALTSRRGSRLVDRPQLLPELAVPWH
jgi:hypothetical protein